MSICSHCAGDGLLHLFNSVGPEPCPKCGPAIAPVKHSTTPIVVTIRKGSVGYYTMAPGGSQCGHRPTGGWQCTREKGHTSIHAGHMPDGTQTATWG